MKGKVLWLDDEVLHVLQLIQRLQAEGIDVEHFSRPPDLIRYLLADAEAVSAVVLDMVMSGHPVITVPNLDGKLQHLYTNHGYDVGLVLGRWIKQRWPRIGVIGLSVMSLSDESSWFVREAEGYFRKGDVEDGLFVDHIRRIVFGLERQKGIKSFIVHGHDTLSLLELKNFLQNRLGLAQPVVLRERPEKGRTIIEKFEEEARGVELVFVLLTPDDKAHGSTPREKRRARQNVIFELGYFYAKLRRRQGRVILLYKGNVELPSDIQGVAYINISNGVEAASEGIRREIEGYLGDLKNKAG